MSKDSLNDVRDTLYYCCSTNPFKSVTRSSTPSDFRIAVYPDGSKKLQGAYAWWEGFSKSGVDWKDIPEVYINDEEGLNNE
jgi:hypothetical protein